MASLLFGCHNRLIHVGSCFFGRNSFSPVSSKQASRFMEKALNKHKCGVIVGLEYDTRLARLVDNDEAGSVAARSKCAASTARVRALRSSSTRHRQRVSSLSRIYLQRIVELLSDSAAELLSDRLVEARLHITKVQLSGNMSRLYVFWTVTPPQQSPLSSQCDTGTSPSSSSSSCHWSPPTDQRLELLQRDLSAFASQLRQLLGQQHVTSLVPSVTFMHDASAWRYEQIQRLLATTDYGVDYMPSDPLHQLRRQLARNQPITQQLRRLSLERVTEQRNIKFPPSADVSDDDENDDDSESTFHSVDVGGLNRQVILLEMKESIRRSSAAYRCYQEAVEAAGTGNDNDGDAGKVGVDTQESAVSVHPEAITPWNKQYPQYRRLGQMRSRVIKYESKVVKRALRDDMQNIRMMDDDDSDDEVFSDDDAPCFER